MAFAFLPRWLRRPSLRPDLHVLVYTRERCGLCDEAWQLLESYRSRYGFVLNALDVDESDDLVREYGSSVPVVTINGRVHFRGRVNEVLLQRILDRVV